MSTSEVEVASQRPSAHSRRYLRAPAAEDVNAGQSIVTGESRNLVACIIGFACIRHVRDCVFFPKPNQEQATAISISILL